MTLTRREFLARRGEQHRGTGKFMAIGLAALAVLALPLAQGFPGTLSIPLFAVVVGVLFWTARSMHRTVAQRRRELQCPRCGAPTLVDQGTITLSDGRCTACGMVVFAEAGSPAGEDVLRELIAAHRSARRRAGFYHVGGTLAMLTLFSIAGLGGLPTWARGVLSATAVILLIGSLGLSERAIRNGGLRFESIVLPPGVLFRHSDLVQRVAIYRRHGLFVTLGLYLGIGGLLAGSYLLVRMGWDPHLQSFLPRIGGLALLVLSAVLAAEKWLVVSLGLTCPGCGVVLVGDARKGSTPLARNTLETLSCWDCGRRVAQ